MRLGRVVGIETEYGVASAHADRVAEGAAPPLIAEDAVKEIFRHTPQRFRSANHFLANGARLYVDIGSHPEYASAECVDLPDLLAQTRAGDAILADMVATANEHLGARARIHLLKTNADAYGNTFGCHENYQVRRDTDLPMAGFVGFLAARQILTGAGTLPFPGEDAFAGRPAPTSPLAPMLFSARAPHVLAATSADPTHERAFVNTRDEPHADRAKWRRLHVIASDTTMSEATTAVKVALTDAVLTLIETGGWDLADCELTDPIRAVNAWNLDPTTPADRPGRPAITCPDLLRLVLARVGPLLAERGPLAARALDLAGRGVDALETGRYEDVATELDWAIKHRVLRRVAEGAPAGWDDPRTLRAALAFHDISDASGLGSRLRAAGLIESWVSDEAVAAARTTPPAGTRAAARGAFARAVAETGRDASIGWAHVRLDRPARPQIDLPEPLEPHSPEVDALVAELYALGQN